MAAKCTLTEPPTSKYKGFKAGDSCPKCYFSNFFVSEFTFMSLRTNNPRLKALYIAMRDFDWDSDEGYEKFKECRQRLQPSTRKKYDKPNYRDIYLKNASAPEPRVAAGVLAQLISRCYKTTEKKRLAVVNEMANEWLTDEQREQWPDPILATDFIDGTMEQKQAWMMMALQHKYSIPFFRELLCATDDGWLWERGGPRDAASNFVGEKGLLTTCLKQTKANMCLGGKADTKCEDGERTGAAAKKQRMTYKQYVQDDTI